MSEIDITLDGGRVMLKLGSLFSGSGTCELAAVLCGINPVWASEIEKFPVQVTSKRFPNMKHLGDILGRTLEYTETYGLVPMLEGRSSIGRLGLFVHVTAGFGDVGFKGYWTLEIHCIQPIRIYPYVEICQIYYHTIQGNYIGYTVTGKYQSNKGIQPSMLYKEF